MSGTWYCGRVRRGREGDVSDLLSNSPIFFGVWVPRFYHNGRALYGGYVFLQFDPVGDGWVHQVRLAGIRMIVLAGVEPTKPAPVSDETITAMHEVCSWVELPVPPLVPGQNLRLRSGLWGRRISGVCREVRGHRVVMENAFGRVSVNLDQVELDQ